MKEGKMMKKPAANKGPMKKPAAYVKVALAKKKIAKKKNKTSKKAIITAPASMQRR